MWIADDAAATDNTTIEAALEKKVLVPRTQEK